MEEDLLSKFQPMLELIKQQNLQVVKDHEYREYLIKQTEVLAEQLEEAYNKNNYYEKMLEQQSHYIERLVFSIKKEIAGIAFSMSCVAYLFLKMIGVIS